MGLRRRRRASACAGDEAKGLGFRNRWIIPISQEHRPRLEDQARTQVKAAGTRNAAWFFAEPEAAEKAREIFGDDDQLQKIEIFYLPAEAP